jgi:multiple antibiotic resistance protein
VFLGQAVFHALGILIEDFMIAGGIVLLIIAVSEIVRAGERKILISPTIGVVPFGTPLIAGPAMLTTTLVLVGTYGYLPVILSLIVNILLAWAVFAQADRIIRLIGISGSRAFAKIAALLPAIAVKMIRAVYLRLSGFSEVKRTLDAVYADDRAWRQKFSPGALIWTPFLGTKKVKR